MSRVFSAALAAAVLSGAAFCAPAYALTEAQEASACEGDALRLCAPYVPDKAKIHSCLVTYKNYLSPACRAIVAPGKKKK